MVARIVRVSIIKDSEHQLSVTVDFSVSRSRDV
jgi:hypothetical protein